MTIDTEPDRTAVTVPSDIELARSLDGDFRSDHLLAGGLRLHYVAGGAGRPLILLPGWPETWWEFRKVMPALAASGRRVIAVDLPGMGGSDKPATGYDKKTMAGVIHAFVRALGYEQVDIAGHDVGSQVAFSFAVNYPEATRKVAMLDILHPDPAVYEIRMLPVPGVPLHPWWFAFNQVTGLPEQLLAGRFRTLIDWLFDNFLDDRNSVTPLDRAVYAHAYDSPDGIRSGNAWFATFGQDVVDLAAYGKVTAPLLGMVSNLGDGMFAEAMQATLPNQGTDVEIAVLPDAGHYFVDERPQAVIERFDTFFV
ncbi:alpha/beta hydrolase [Nocardia terpenica]|uniref:alpha/beta fold hydrolase n=1 Tax=Nocardia terpenica TaxID=455432 RepID=UPI001895E987|nr:alpha/beta hydrolase [Nocardia terpenica]MBF6064120.1 alpha/beta hydrolase [Nocardia terpenica]MBF6106453.1 alpha/beta hydrolase [Nocardia terpenica]MBF6113738.1 alpha/beta hydrolase [Nocardia terpenica]MBF6120638.1 alpha/beta hydrolase [Nocardia terpenica]MBF6154705.1 alpha/beta hydrolase [Nocardia terpenica]